MSTYDLNDIKFYLDGCGEILGENITDEDTPLPEKNDELIQTLGKSLNDIFFALRRREEEAFSEKMRKQRYERGYADIDVWDISEWFIDIVTPMLRQLRNTHHGSPAYLGKNYVDENGNMVNPECHEEWDKILDRMIFLLGEMKEETRTVSNPYEDEYDKVLEEFQEKYRQKENEDRKFHSMREIPEYKAVQDKYIEKEKELEQYSDQCKDEFFELFSKHFWDLWD